jgi:Ser/Thr protein kinase RdoA (MazF antagonist)
MQRRANYNTLIRLLRIMAEAALTTYDLGSVRLALLSHHRNTVFRVDTQPYGALNASNQPQEEGRYILRFCDMQRLTIEMIRSEVQWLLAIREETDLCVPEPVPARNGEYVVDVQMEGVDMICRCLLLRWVPGRTVDSGLSPTLLERVGMLQARLHQHAQTFVPSADFVRPASDWQQFLANSSDMIALINQRHKGLLNAADKDLLARAAMYAWEEIATLARSPESYGLVHGDLQQAHYVFQRGNVHALGFDRCCSDYFLSDSAVTLSGLAGREDELALRKAYWQGYGRILTPPAHSEMTLDAFFVAHTLRHLNDLVHFTNFNDDKNEIAFYFQSRKALLQQFVTASVQR